MHGFEAEIVDDQERWSQMGCRRRSVRPVSQASVEMGQHLVGADEEHVVATAASFVSQGLSQMTFANPGWPADQRIAPSCDVGAGGECPGPAGG